MRGFKTAVKGTQLTLLLTILSAGALELETPYAPNLPPAAAEKLDKYKLIPDLLSRPPQLYAQVQFHDGTLADYGNVITEKQMLKPPDITWAAEKDTEHTVVVMDLDHHVPRPNATEIHYAYWVIGNVLSDSIKGGHEIVPYEAPKILDGSAELHRICFLVYYQIDGPRDFYTPNSTQRQKDYRMWFNIHNLTDKYIVIGPVAMNFVLAPVQVPKLDGPVKETWT